MLKGFPKYSPLEHLLKTLKKDLLIVLEVVAVNSPQVFDILGALNGNFMESIRGGASF